MAVNSRHRKTVLASIVTVAVIMLVFGMYRYSGSPRPTGVDLATDQSERHARRSSLAEALRPAGQKAAIGEDSAAGPGADGYEPRVSIDVSEGGILVVAVEATLQEVLDVMVDRKLVEVADLRSEDERLSEAAQFERRSFRFSGSVDDVLRSVMGQYRYNYVLSASSHPGTQAQLPLAKLFLYGTMRGEGPQPVDESGDVQYSAPARAQAVSTPVHAESEVDDASDSETTAKDRATVSDLLRQRALATVNRAASGAGSAAAGQTEAAPGTGAAVDKAPISGDLEDEATTARLAEMARRASEQVRALAEQLKAAEQSLELQRANQYGDTVP